MAVRKYVIIIGAMKSGTTTLFNVLARHPAIAPASNKEPGFFAFDEVWDRGFDWFDTLFDFDPTRHVYRLEASTDYTKAPFVTGVWERMTANPEVEVKLIYIMRDPIRRIESHARHVQWTKKEVGQHISPKTDHSLDAGVSPVNLAVSRYADQLDVYQQAWEKNQLHLVVLEALKTDPEAVLADVWSFLELEPEPGATDIPVSNASGTHTRLHPAWHWMTRMQPLVTLGKWLVPKRLRQTIRAVFRLNVRSEGRFDATAAETRRLEEQLSDDLKRLGSSYGVEADWI